MKLKIKRKYTVAGKVYTIKFVDSVDDDNSMGECDIVNRVIYIKKDMSYRDTIITVIHELRHATFEEMKWSEGIPDIVENIMVDMDAQLMYEWFFKCRKN